MNRITRLTTNSFYHWAETYRKEITKESEIELLNRTTMFWQVIESSIILNGIIIININAKMRGGKSTVGLLIGKKIQDLLISHGQQITPFGLNNVCRDQIEYVRKMCDEKLHHNCLVIDEEDIAEHGGENVTSENQAKENFIKLQAARYNHTVWIQPTGISNPHADILLDLLEPDKTTGTTRGKLTYRYIEQCIERTQLLGFVDFLVLPLIKNWLILEPYFLASPMQEPTLLDCEDDETVFKRNHKYWSKNNQLIKLRSEMLKKYSGDFYCNYMLKKFTKFELTTKHGIFKPKELDYSDVVLSVVKKKMKIASLGYNITGDNLSSAIKREYRERKINASIVGVEIEKRHAKGILDNITEQAFLQKKIVQTKQKMKFNPKQIKEYQKELERYTLALEQFSQEIEDDMNYLERLSKIKKVYDNEHKNH